MAVKAGNSKGLAPTPPCTGTPNKEGFDLPALPTDGRIDNGEITSIVMQDPSNVNRNLCPNFDVTTHLTDNDPTPTGSLPPILRTATLPIPSVPPTI